MFTGLVKKIGEVKEINSHHGDIQVVILTDKDFAGMILNGDSISINGVCLTAYNIYNDYFSFDISNETLDITSLTQLKTGYKVNIETSLSLQDKVGGHIVSGHVDCTAKVLNISKDFRSYKICIQLNDSYYSKYIVKKGSICIDGTSLTVNKEENDSFYVNIIPYTWNNTIMQFYNEGTIVNIEVDRIALYLEKLFKQRD